MTTSTKRTSRANDLPVPDARAIARLSIAVPLPSFDDPELDFEDGDYTHWEALAAHTVSRPSDITLDEAAPLFMDDEEVTTFETPFLDEEFLADDNETEDVQGRKAARRDEQGSEDQQGQPEGKRTRLSMEDGELSEPEEIEQRRLEDPEMRASISQLGLDPFDQSELPLPEMDASRDFLDDDIPLPDDEHDISRRASSLGAMDAPTPARRKRKINRDRRDKKTELTERQLKSFRRKVSELVRPAPEQTRKLALWTMAGGRVTPYSAAPASSEQLFNRMRVPAFPTTVHAAFAAAREGAIRPPTHLEEGADTNERPPATNEDEAEVRRAGDDFDASLRESFGQDVGQDAGTEELPMMEDMPLEDFDQMEDPGSRLDATPANISRGSLGAMSSPEMLANRLRTADTVLHEQEKMVIEAIDAQLEDADTTTFSKVLGPRPNKMGASRAFFQLLSLATKGRITVGQKDFNGEITIRN